MLAQRTHVRAVVFAFLTLFIAAMSAVPAAAHPRLPDGVPAGVTIPNVPGDNQAYEFGDCQSRKHSTGGWVCAPLPEEIRAAAAHASKKQTKRKKGAKARAAAYYRYSFNAVANAYWGIGSVTYGAISWTRKGYFNGQYVNLNQSGTVVQGAHTVRYNFFVDHWRSTSAGWEYRTGYESIKPAYPGCTRTTTSMVGNGQNWVNYNAAGYDFWDLMFFKLRDCVLDNPSTPDGTFYSPNYSTKVYHCNSTECYFKGY
jgi:hypothetical protein